jgi:hypothetical protein
LNNKEAKVLTTKALSIEKQRLQIFKKYISEFGGVVRQAGGAVVSTGVTDATAD